MIGSEDPQIRRKLIEILRIIRDHDGAVGARVISDTLNERGYRIGERGVRYHLRILDERGFTKKEGYAGRNITEMGLAELNEALVGDRIGFITTHIEELIYEMDFNLKNKEGHVIVNTSLIDKRDFEDALQIIELVTESGLNLGPYIAIEDEDISDSDSEELTGNVVIHTMCSITLDGILLQYGIPSSPKYGGIIEIKDYEPMGFVDLVSYKGTTVDPMKLFMAKKATSVFDCMEHGNGKILGNVRELPASAIPDAEKVLDLMLDSGFAGLVNVSDVSQPALNAPIATGRAGIAISAGINSMAAVLESGIDVTNYPISALRKFSDMKKIR